MNQQTIRGLYVVTPEVYANTRDLIERVALAIRGGASIVQYRDKNASPSQRLLCARDLALLCRSQNVLLIVNDEPVLAHESGANGVHVGQTDASLAEARAVLGNDGLVGVTCHASMELAVAAVRSGADYVAFGSFFPSITKPTAFPATMAVLKSAKSELNVPVVAIGGITLDNGADLIAAGADVLAVSHAVFGATDPEEAARDFTALFQDE